MKHLVRFGVLAALAVMLPALLAHAAPAPAPATIGVIDIDAVRQNYHGMQAALDYLKVIQTDREKLLSELGKGQYLTPDQFKEFQEMVPKPVKIPRYAELLKIADEQEKTFTALVEKVKAGLSDDERTRLAELEQAPSVSAEEEKEYYALLDKGKAKLVEADRKQLEEMEAHQDNVVQAFIAARDGYVKEMQSERERVYKVVDDQITLAMETCAKNNKLAVVLNRNAAGAQGALKFVLWGGQDITEAVTKLANGSFKPELFTKKP